MYQYQGESLDKFQARIIYSAISYWIRVNTISDDFKSISKDLIGVSKLKNTLDSSITLNAFFEIFPNTRDWFCGYKTEELISKIRTILESVGELISHENRIVLTDKDSAIFRDKFNRTSVLQSCFDYGYISGMIWFHNFDHFIGIKFEHYIQVSAKKFVEVLMKNAKFSMLREDDELEFFMPSYDKPFYTSWYDSRKVIENHIYLVRKKAFIGYDFYWYKTLNSDKYLSKINDLYKEDFEINRLLHGLNEIYGYNSESKYIIHDKSNTINFSLKNSLPNYEKQILDAICWPRDSIDDKQNFVANSKVLPLITKVLNRLSIRFKEGERNE